MANNIGGKYGDKYINLIMDEEKKEINRSLFLMINGKEMRNYDLKLKDKDVLVIGQIVSGG